VLKAGATPARDEDTELELRIALFVDQIFHFCSSRVGKYQRRRHLGHRVHSVLLKFTLTIIKRHGSRVNAASADGCSCRVHGRSDPTVQGRWTPRQPGFKLRGVLVGCRHRRRLTSTASAAERSKPYFRAGRTSNSCSGWPAPPPLLQGCL